MFHGHLDYFSKPSFGGRLNTKPGDHGTPNVHDRWFTLFYHVRGPTWIEIHWNNIWLRTQSHMASNYSWESMTTLCDFGSVLGRPLDTFIWALTISWSQLLARVWSGPNSYPKNSRCRVSYNSCNLYSVEGFSLNLIGIQSVWTWSERNSGTKINDHEC